MKGKCDLMPALKTAQMSSYHPTTRTGTFALLENLAACWRHMHMGAITNLNELNHVET
jgi:hypothetical protein